MGLIEQAKEDIEDITSDLEGWGVPLHFKAPTLEEVDIVGLFIKRTVAAELDGSIVNSKLIHCTFSEKFLTDLSYPVRNAAGLVHLQGHILTATDSTGVAGMYIFKEWHPDETVGLIRCVMGEYSE